MNISDAMKQLASQQHMLAQGDGSLATHYFDRQMKRRKYPPRNPDEWHRDTAVTVLQAIAAIEADIDTIADPSTQVAATGVLSELRDIMADIAAATPRNTPIDPRVSWHHEFVRAAQFAPRIREIAGRSSATVARFVSIRKSDIIAALDLSEKEWRAWRDHNAKAIRGTNTAKRIDLNLAAIGTADAKKIENHIA